MKINNVPCSLNIIKDGKLHLKCETSDEINLSIIKNEIKFSHKDDLKIQMEIPQKLKKISIEITGKILNLEGKEVSLTSKSDIIEIGNSIGNE